MNRWTSQAPPAHRAACPATVRETMPIVMGSVRTAEHRCQPATPRRRRTRTPVRRRLPRSGGSGVRSARPAPARVRRRAVDRDGEAQQHTGHGGVHPGRVHQRPGRRGQGEQQPPRPHPTLHQQREHTEREQSEQQRHHRQLGGVEDRDDGDGQQVVDHGQGQQEDPQGRGQMGADDGQHGQGERDVGCGGDRPTAAVPPPAHVRARGRAAPVPPSHRPPRRPGAPRGAGRAGRPPRTRV